MVMLFIKTVNLALRFLLELGVLASLGYFGFRIQNAFIVKWAIGLGAPLLVIYIWGTFGSPAAPRLLSEPLHFILEIVVFGSGVVALFAAGRPALAGVFAILILINRILMYVWGQ